jgi:hypothetical protein
MAGNGSGQEAIRYSEYMRTREERIAVLAHHYWLLRGCPEGSLGVDWLLAETQFDQEFLDQLELGRPA